MARRSVGDEGGTKKKRNKKEKNPWHQSESSSRTGESESGSGKLFGGGSGGEENPRDDGQEGHSGVGRRRRVGSVGEWVGIDERK